MTTQHTPGPWKANQTLGSSDRFAGGNVTASDGRSVCAIGGNINRPHDEKKANTYLIAAAPELLAIAELVRDSKLIPEWSELGKAARAAIAKARGD